MARVPTEDLERPGSAPSLTETEFGVGDTRTAPPGEERPAVDDVKMLPTRIGRFVVIREIGSGAMGVVYAAYDEMLDRKVAVKLLHTSHATSKEARARLLREAQTIAKLSHPNVIQVYEVGTLGEQVFVAMEFIDGITLRSWQEDPGRGWREVLDKYVAAGRGLAAAHAAGIVHRDFKPDNVLVGIDGQVRVLDFGLARPAARDGSEDSGVLALSTVDGSMSTDRTGRPLTRTGAILGTPAYMAPEQYEGEPAGPQTDQFALGVSLYEGLYGSRPFPGDTLASLATHVLDGYIADPPAYSKVPPWLRKVVLRALRTKAGDRYPTVAALLADLGRDPRALARRVVGGLALVAAIAGLSVGVWAIQRQDQARDEGDRLRAEFERARVMSVEDQLQASRERTVSENWDELVLTYARESLQTDPTAAMAALKHLTPDNDRWLPAARTIAGEARRRGVARRRMVPNIGQVLALAFSPDGTRIGMAGSGGKTVVFSLDTGERTDLAGHRGAVNSVTFSPDGELLATAGDDATVRIWPLSGGRRRSLRGHAGPVRDVVFAPDGERIASGGDDRTVRVWDLGSRQARTFVNHTAAVHAVDFAPDGESMASASEDGTVRVWFIDEQRSRVLKDHADGARYAKFSADGTWLISVDGTGTVREWSIATGKAKPIAGVSASDALALSEDGTTVLAVADGQPRLHFPELESSQSLLGIGATVTSVALAPDGRAGATATGAGDVLVWGTALERPAQRSRTEVGVERLALTPDGTRLISARSDGTLDLWTLEPDEHAALRYHDVRIAELAACPDGHTLAALDERGALSVWDLNVPDAPPRVLTTEAEPTAKALTWSPDGRWVAVSVCESNASCVIRIHRPDDGVTREVGRADVWVSRLVFGRDGKALLSDHPTAPESLRLWELETNSSRSPSGIEPAMEQRLGFAFVEDGAAVRIATQSWDDEEAETHVLRVWQWNAARGDAHVIFERTGLRGLVAARNTPTLLIQTADDRALLWHIAGDQFRVLPPLEAAMRSFAMAPDERTILLGRWGGGTDDQRYERMIDVGSGQGRELPTLYTPLSWASDGHTIADVHRRKEVRVWRDPTPETPAAFVDWLAEETDRTIYRSWLR